MTRVASLTTGTFVDEVVRAAIPVLVEFWAPWCPPCVAMAPVVQRIADEHDGTLRVVKVNVDDAPTLAALAGIESIPFLLLFRDGRPVGHLVGVRPQHEIEEHLGIGAPGARGSSRDSGPTGSGWIVGWPTTGCSPSWACASSRWWLGGRRVGAPPAGGRGRSFPARSAGAADGTPDR